MPTRIDRYCMYWDTVLQQIFTVIKTGNKYEKLFFGREKTLFEILEIQFLKLATVRDFRDHFEIIFGNNFWCSNI